MRTLMSFLICHRARFSVAAPLCSLKRLDAYFSQKNSTCVTPRQEILLTFQAFEIRRHQKCVDSLWSGRKIRIRGHRQSLWSLVSSVYLPCRKTWLLVSRFCIMSPDKYHFYEKSWIYFHRISSSYKNPVCPVKVSLSQALNHPLWFAVGLEHKLSS